MLDKIKKIFKRDPRREEEFGCEIKRDGGLEKNDMFAMLLSAYLTIIPIVLLVMAVFVLIAYLYVS